VALLYRLPFAPWSRAQSGFDDALARVSAALADIAQVRATIEREHQALAGGRSNSAGLIVEESEAAVVPETADTGSIAGQRQPCRLTHPIGITSRR
jgi:hypothetical protein